MPRSPWQAARGWAPEIGLAAMSLVVFLGFLGSVDLKGKREQRAAAEALDTATNGHWLIAEIQSRPRLEKPPLPRWPIAALISLTGRVDEWIVRLPSALAAIAMVALIYDLGRRLGGRSVGLASGLALATTGCFVVEARQAGNDAPLALFTTLALYAAWRRLNGSAIAPEPSPEAINPPQLIPTATLGSRAWNLLFYTGLGLGVLSKGPVILGLVVLTLLPYLLLSRRAAAGLHALADGWGFLLFAAISLCWPLPVALSEQHAIGVWYLEIGQKAVGAGVEDHKDRPLLALDWLWMVLPWTPMALLGLALPFMRTGRALRPAVWLPWSWAAVNLLMFSVWTVSKPNYYVPCLPGVALLVGLEWTRIVHHARAGAVGALRLIQFCWVVPFVSAFVAPVVVAREYPMLLDGAILIAVFSLACVVYSARAWRRGAVVGVMAPFAVGVSFAVLILYGMLAPRLLNAQSHRPLAATLDHLVPPDQRTLMFFDELDEGLWFYLRDRTLTPVPGSQPRLNRSFDMVVDNQNQRLVKDPELRMKLSLELLLKWLEDPASHPSPFILIRAKLYDRFAPELAGRVEVLYHEPELNRASVVLLRALPHVAVASNPKSQPR
jgi:4-amino-4-deoxy-L-arabinose transferase-like glycosyltransferase